MKPAILFLLGLACCAGAQQADSDGIVPTANQAGAPRVLLGMPPRLLGVPAIPFAGEPKCDANGDLFFDVSTGPVLNTAPFLEVKADGSSHQLFTLPAELSKNTTSGIAFQAVSPSGNFYILNTDFKRYSLIAYRQDGTVKSMHDLAMPANVSLVSVAVADSGVLYVQGYLSTNDSREKPRKTYAALLTDAGKVIRDFSQHMADVNLASRQDHPLETAVTAGDDGRFYLLGPNKVSILNQIGEIVRTLSFTKPDPNMYAVRVDVSRNLVSIELNGNERVPGKFVPISVRMLVLDSQTGEQRGDYKLDPTLSNAVLCFTAKDGYVVIANHDGQAATQLEPLP